MDQQEVPRDKRDLRDNPQLLSPPGLADLYQCAVTVTVLSFVPHADVDVEISGNAGTSTTTQTVDYPLPSGATIGLPRPLDVSDKVRVRQRQGGRQSLWSAPPASVRDHTKDFPAGPPRPEINPAPVFRCGSRTGVANLLGGGNVWITADGAEVGRVNGCKEHQGVDVNPDYGPDQHVRAWFDLCHDPSPPSQEFVTQPPPSPLPTPGFDPAYDSGEQVRITNIVNGARVTLLRKGISHGPYRCWGDSILVPLQPANHDGDKLDAFQTMCAGDPPSLTGSTTVLPCADLPAPLLGPVQDGDDRITLVQFIPDAVIKIYVNGVKVAEGGGPVVLLPQPVQHGDVIDVEQVLGDCHGKTVREIKPACVDPPLAGDPSTLDLFPVGSLEYDDGKVKGSVYYPAQDDGVNQPFNARLAALGRVPIVFIVHGNHQTHFNPNNRMDEWMRDCDPSSPNQNPPNGWLPVPNYQGYDYWQQQLARMGFIAASVNCNATNCWGGGPSNIEQRADLVIGSIDHFRTQDATPGSVFHQVIDFQRVGLMGHSRGGDTVVLVPEVITLAGVTIRAALALAPTDFGPSSKQPKGYAFMTILPAADGDVGDNEGAVFYDQAQPGPFKSQLYVHSANHNFFNRQWLKDDGVTAVMSRPDHERVLSVYGCALLRAALLGQTAMTAFLFGRWLPAGVRAENVHLSFVWQKAFTVDDHVAANWVPHNSLNLPTMQSGGLVASEFSFHQGSGAFNNSFFGSTIGMVVIHTDGTNGRFRSPLHDVADLSKQEVWIRTAEVFTGAIPGGSTGFQLGVEDEKGVVAWVDSDDVGGLPRPFSRPSATKTMLKTLRFPGLCFAHANPQLDLRRITALLIGANRGDGRPLAFDDWQIVAQ